MLFTGISEINRFRRPRVDEVSNWFDRLLGQRVPLIEAVGTDRPRSVREVVNEVVTLEINWSGAAMLP
jgi:hypothetical protein